MVKKHEMSENKESNKKNYRNGYSAKNLRSFFGDVDLEVPRDRNAEFEPQIIKKYETACTELDKKILPEIKISSNILMINVLITQNYLESL